MKCKERIGIFGAEGSWDLHLDIAARDMQEISGLEISFIIIDGVIIEEDGFLVDERGDGSPGSCVMGLEVGSQEHRFPRS